MTNYLDLAEKAKGEKAHVAVVMYYRNAADEATDNQTLGSVVESAVGYAGCLKKETDQRAVYEWAHRVAENRLPETGLAKKIELAMQELGGEENDTTSIAS